MLITNNLVKIINWTTSLPAGLITGEMRPAGVFRVVVVGGVVDEAVGVRKTGPRMM